MTDVFTHPWLGGLFSDPETQALLAPAAQLQHMLDVEAAYTLALGHVGTVPPHTAERTASLIRTATPQMGALHSGTALDGVVVPALVRALKEQLPADTHAQIHSGLTSQDVIDTALVLSLKSATTLFCTRLSAVHADLHALSQAQGSHTMIGRTRMQAALPISAAHRMQSWSHPLSNHLQRWTELAPRVLCLQLGGAVGDRAALGVTADAVALHMAQTLHLHAGATHWHNRRDGLAEFANWLSLITGSLGKMGQDIALMAQQGVDEISLSGGGGSSAMPHKQNPVLAELLVSLARFNATQLSAMHHATVHEQERSGAAWTLEWMILPQMVLATGRALQAAAELVAQIKRVGSVS